MKKIFFILLLFLAQKNTVIPASPSAFSDPLSFHGLRTGTVFLDDTVYIMTTIEPVLYINKLAITFYLPIFYTGNDIFDPGNWYKPKGNNVWSFGLDSEDFTAGDLISDLLLKVKSIHWQGDNSSPIHFEIGDLSNYTLGHGLLINKYYNNQDYPALRRLGLNFGGHWDKWGFDLMASDISDPLQDLRITGSRVYINSIIPGIPLDIATSVVADFNPGSDLKINIVEPVYGYLQLPSRDLIGDPLFIYYCLDLQLLLLNIKDQYNLSYFIDFGKVLPIFRKSGGQYDHPLSPVDFTAIDEDLDIESESNYGISTGINGKINNIDFKLETRFFYGIFNAALYNQFYERMRGYYAAAVARYLTKNWSGDLLYWNCEFYGEIGYTLDNIYSFILGYKLNLNRDFIHYNTDTLYTPSELSFGLELGKGFFSSKRFSLTIEYINQGFISLLLKYFNGDMTLGQLFGWQSDANHYYTDFFMQKMFRVELNYGLSDDTALVLSLFPVISRDSATGSIHYSDRSKYAEMDLVLILETQFSF